METLKIKDCLYGQVRSVGSTINGRDHFAAPGGVHITEIEGTTWDNNTILNPIQSSADKYTYAYDQMFKEARPWSVLVARIAAKIELEHKTFITDYDKLINEKTDRLLYSAFVLGKWFLIEQICKNNKLADVADFYSIRQYDTWWPEIIDSQTIHELLEQAGYKPNVPFALVKNIDTIKFEDPEWKWNFPMAASMMTDSFMLNQAAIDKLAGNFFMTALKETDKMSAYFGNAHRCLTDMPGTVLSNIFTKNDIIIVNTRAVVMPEVNPNWTGSPTYWDRLCRLNINLTQ